MPVPVTAFAAGQFPTAKALNMALYTSDGSADNPTGLAFLACRPVLLEAYTRTTTFHASSGGSQSTMSTSGSVTSCSVVYDTAGYFGQASDLPGTGYYQYTAVIEGSAGDGQTPGGWQILTHFAPLKPTGTQTSVSADLIPVTGGTVSGSRQAPNATNDSCPFFCDLQNTGTSVWQPGVTIRDSAGSATTNAVNASDASGETPRFAAVWAAVSATTSGQAIYAANGTYTFTNPAGVTAVTAAVTGSGAGGGAGNVSVGGTGYGGGGAGGGEDSLGTVTVTPGSNYPVTVGAGGAGGTSPGGNGGGGALSSFAGDSVTITGHGGSDGAGATTSADGTGGAGGTGSGAAVHYNGGAGAAGTTGTGGGGGGSAAGTGQAGNAGMGAAGGTAPAGGGPGGTGGAVTITVVQQASATNDNKASLTLNFGSAIQAGNTVIAVVQTQSTGGGDPTVMLSDGTALTSQANADQSGTFSVSLNVFAAFNVTGGQTSLKVSGLTGTQRVINVQMSEVAGLGPSPTVDAQNSNTGHQNSFSVSQATAGAPELWIAATGGQLHSTPGNFSISPSTGNGWHLFSTIGSNPGYSVRLRSGYQVVTAPGTMTYKGSFSTTIWQGSVVVAFESSTPTVGSAPVTGPGGGGGGGFAANNGGAGSDGYVKLTWTGVSGSGYGTPPLPAPFTSWSADTTVGTTGMADVNLNGPAGITGVVNYLCNPPAVRVQGTSAQSIATASVVAVTFSGGTTATDSYSGYSAGTYTVPRDGLYLFHGLVCFAANSTGTRQAGVTVNSVTYWGPGYKAATSGTTNATKTQILSLRAGDTVVLAARQDSGGSLALSVTDATRFFLAWLCAPDVPAQPWAPPDTTFRWAAGTTGNVLASQFATHLGNDLNFLVTPPYLMAYQVSAQSGLAAGSFSTISLDTVGGVVHSDNGDPYGGWTAGAANLYTAPAAGWYLHAGEFFAASSAASGATVVAGIAPSTSGGHAPVHPADYYQANTATSTASVGGGATVLALNYLSAGETLSPQIMAQSYAGAYSTLTGAQNSGLFYPHWECCWISE